MHLFRRVHGKRLLVHGIRVARDEYQYAKEYIERSSTRFRLAVYIFAIYFFLAIGFGIYWASRRRYSMLKRQSNLSCWKKIYRPALRCSLALRQQQLWLQ